MTPELRTDQPCGSAPADASLCTASTGPVAAFADVSHQASVLQAEMAAGIRGRAPCLAPPPEYCSGLTATSPGGSCTPLTTYHSNRMPTCSWSQSPPPSTTHNRSSAVRQTASALACSKFPPAPYVSRRRLTYGRYGPSCTAMLSVRYKIHDRDPSQLVQGWEGRLARLVGRAGITLTGAYVRAGCVELTLDLLVAAMGTTTAEPSTAVQFSIRSTSAATGAADAAAAPDSASAPRMRTSSAIAAAATAAGAELRTTTVMAVSARTASTSDEATVAATAGETPSLRPGRALAVGPILGALGLGTLPLRLDSSPSLPPRLPAVGAARSLSDSGVSTVPDQGDEAASVVDASMAVTAAQQLTSSPALPSLTEPPQSPTKEQQAQPQQQERQQEHTQQERQQQPHQQSGEGMEQEQDGSGGASHVSESGDLQVQVQILGLAAASPDAPRVLQVQPRVLLLPPLRPHPADPEGRQEPGVSAQPTEALLRATICWGNDAACRGARAIECHTGNGTRALRPPAVIVRSDGAFLPARVTRFRRCEPAGDGAAVDSEAVTTADAGAVQALARSRCGGGSTINGCSSTVNGCSSTINGCSSTINGCSSTVNGGSSGEGGADGERTRVASLAAGGVASGSGVAEVPAEAEDGTCHGGDGLYGGGGGGGSCREHYDLEVMIGLPSCAGLVLLELSWDERPGQLVPLLALHAQHAAVVSELRALTAPVAASPTDTAAHLSDSSCCRHCGGQLQPQPHLDGLMLDLGVWAHEDSRKRARVLTRTTTQTPAAAAAAEPAPAVRALEAPAPVLRPQQLALLGTNLLGFALRVGLTATEAWVSVGLEGLEPDLAAEEGEAEALEGPGRQREVTTSPGAGERRCGLTDPVGATESGEEAASADRSLRVAAPAAAAAAAAQDSQCLRQQQTRQQRRWWQQEGLLWLPQCLRRIFGVKAPAAACGRAAGEHCIGVHFMRPAQVVASDPRGGTEHDMTWFQALLIALDQRHMAAAEEAAYRVYVTPWLVTQEHIIQVLQCLVLPIVLCRTEATWLNLSNLICAVAIVPSIVSILAYLLLPYGVWVRLVLVAKPARYVAYTASKALSVLSGVPVTQSYLTYQRGLAMLLHEGLMLPLSCLLPVRTATIMTVAKLLPCIAMMLSSGVASNRREASQRCATVAVIALPTTALCHAYMRMCYARSRRRQRGDVAVGAGAIGAGPSTFKTVKVD